jgi:hypothetical protein
MKRRYEYAINQSNDDGNTQLEDEEAKVWNRRRKKIKSKSTVTHWKSSVGNSCGMVKVK